MPENDFPAYYRKNEMNYEEAMSFLEDTKKYGSRPGLDTIRRLMHALGDVQDRVPAIHISGTNGKGSAGALLSSVFTEAGYRVGWFNTPDVFSYEEEFRMNGEPIGRERLASLFAEVKTACGRIMARDGGPHPTRFEVETAAAYLWFYEEDCEIALVEVGMGGAKDATNVISRPLVSVLTPIGLDHTQFLGNSLEEIAREKAGVIKPGCPVVTAGQEPVVMQVIRKRCEALCAPLYLADAGECVPYVYRDGASEFDYNGERIRLGLAGPFQMENASCALKVLEVLREFYPERFPLLTDETIARGMERARWPGRYERILGGRDAGGPCIIMDGGHNEIAAERLREALDADFPDRRILYIMGVLADKDYEAMADTLFRAGDRVRTVEPANHRALPAKELADALRRHRIDAVPCASVRGAVSLCLEEASAGDVIVALGSLFNLREVRKAFFHALQSEPEEPFDEISQKTI